MKIENINQDKNTLNIKIVNSWTFRDHEIFWELLNDIKKRLKEKSMLKFKDIIVNIDFLNCDFVDSAALGMLVIISDEIINIAKSNNLKIVSNLINANDKLKSRFYEVRFERIFNIK